MMRNATMLGLARHPAALDRRGAVYSFSHGWWMTHLAPRPDRGVNYAWHAALGYDFLALLVVRPFGAG